MILISPLNIRDLKQIQWQLQQKSHCKTQVLTICDKKEMSSHSQYNMQTNCPSITFLTWIDKKIVEALAFSHRTNLVISHCYFLRRRCKKNMLNWKKPMTGVYSAYRNHCFISSKKLMQIYDTLFDVTIVIAEGPYFSLLTQ